VIVFRHADPRFPFLWEGGDQPPARWHGEGDGPVHYFSDTPDGAWAEFLRHEEITSPEDVGTIRRALWAVELGDPPPERPHLPFRTLTGGPETYENCRAAARRVRQRGARGLLAPSAALVRGGARGWRVDDGLQAAAPRNGYVVVLFGRRPDLVGWAATIEGRPSEDLLPRVRRFR
jgi:hypothetical protein